MSSTLVWVLLVWHMGDLDCVISFCLSATLRELEERLVLMLVGGKTQMRELVLGSMANGTTGHETQVQHNKTGLSLFNETVSLPLQSLVLIAMDTLPYRGKQLPKNFFESYICLRHLSRFIKLKAKQNVVSS